MLPLLQTRFINYDDISEMDNFIKKKKTKKNIKLINLVCRIDSVEVIIKNGEMQSE